MRGIAALANVVLVSSCAPSDAPIDAAGGDAAGEASPDAGIDASCSAATVSTGMTGGTCTVRETFTCGSDTYVIDCSCNGVCECVENGAMVGAVPYVSDCPICFTTNPDGHACFPDLDGGP